MNAEMALALGASLNGTAINESALQANSLKPWLLGHLEEWFTYEPYTSLPFDRTSVMQSVEATDENALRLLITQMGFRAEPAARGECLYRVWDKQWERYMVFHTVEIDQEGCTETACPSNDRSTSE